MAKPQTKAADRRAQAMKIRRNILAAQLRVALDKERNRDTPEAVVRLSELPLPEVSVPLVSTRHSEQRHMAIG
jgi:hypothetical protein